MKRAAAKDEIGGDGVWFQNTMETSADTSSKEALRELLRDWQLGTDTNDDDQLLVFLFLSHHWELQDVTSNAMDLLEEMSMGGDEKSSKKDNIHLITVIGGGVIGQNQEYEEEASHPVYGRKAIKKQMSILGGYCKKDEINNPKSSESSSLQVFSMSNNDATVKRTMTTTNQGTNPQQPQPFRSDSSLFVFSDPYCRQIQNLFGELHSLNCQVAGGISVPHQSALYDPTLAINREILPKGSLVGVQLPSNYQLQCVVSQGGCRPVGPTYRVTSVDGPAIHELDQVKALEQLDRLCSNENQSSDEDDGDDTDFETTVTILSPKDQELIRQGGVLAGVFLEASSCSGVDDQLNDDESPSLQPSASIESSSSSAAQDSTEAEGLVEGEYMVREVTGFRPRSGSILVCGQPQVQLGDLFRFHVRSSQEALDDWKLLLKQTKMEQLFLSSKADEVSLDATESSAAAGGDGNLSSSSSSSPSSTTTTSRIVCGMQISSLARGKDFFETPNVDLDHAKMLLESKKNRDNFNDSATPPIGGFFSNAEIGPVGIRMGAQGDSSQPYLHGFATVVAMLCEITTIPIDDSSQGSNGSEDSDFQATISSSQSSWA
ncbi:unnamed protein product [Cylindrotheca closterium]|uniref:FIST domain-containing protein n=1 Tax=Cylindrotheca closterium TaxID=2856 RepID=A0AAD2G2G7_9STRA|nr:unnamed protein product [Cylindrotheca closterium]